VFFKVNGLVAVKKLEFIDEKRDEVAKIREKYNTKTMNLFNERKNTTAVERTQLIRQ
jgi:hypothetical protein